MKREKAREWVRKGERMRRVVECHTITLVNKSTSLPYLCV